MATPTSPINTNFGFEVWNEGERGGDWEKSQYQGNSMEKYTPELLFGLMNTAKNIALIIASAWTTTKLYQMSGSWNCLWALLMLLATGSATFVRD